MKRSGAKASKIGSRAPLAPEQEVVVAEYGEQAALYAGIRAEAAAVSGRAEAAEAWEDVENDIEQTSSQPS